MPLPVRHTPRAKWHDYNGAEYFVTICTADREHYFGTVRNGQTQLTAVGANNVLKKSANYTWMSRSHYM